MLTKADLEQSQQAYSDLLATAKSYRLALAALSTAASAFGSALEACARLKEARAESLVMGGLDATGPGMGGRRGFAASSLATGGGGLLSSNSFGGTGMAAQPKSQPRGSCTADLLLGASGVHHLVANHQQILSETVYRSFEVPLLHELDAWRRAVEDEEEAYRAEAVARGREIRRLEKDGLRLHLHRQQKRRGYGVGYGRGGGRGAGGAGTDSGGGGVGALREHLVGLTARLDGLTALHSSHATVLLRDSQDASARILDASCSLVRAEVDIFESLARKGWSGGGLDDLLERGHDLFAAEDGLLPPPGSMIMMSSTGNGGGGGGGGIGGMAAPAAMGVTAGGLAAVTGGGGAGVGGTAPSTAATATATATATADGGTRAGGGGGGAKLFSILPPKSILADTASDKSRPSGGPGGGRMSSSVGSDDTHHPQQYQHQYQHEQHPGRADSLVVDDTDRYQSLVGAVSVDEEHSIIDTGPGSVTAAAAEEEEEEDDSESIFSDLNLGQVYRPLRPFSPQPIRRQNRTDVIMDPESLLSDDGGDDDGGDDADDGVVEHDDDDETISPWKNEGLSGRERRRLGDSAGGGGDGSASRGEGEDEDGDEDGDEATEGARRPTSPARGGRGGGLEVDLDADVDSSTTEERERRWGADDDADDRYEDEDRGREQDKYRDKDKDDEQRG